MNIYTEPLEISDKSLSTGARRLMRTLMGTEKYLLVKAREIPNMCRQLEEELTGKNTKKARMKLETLRKDMAELRSFLEWGPPAETGLLFVYLS